MDATIPLIGKKYKPTDNSYSNCLSDAVSDLQSKPRHFLAGTKVGHKQITCTIISEPFEMLITRDVVGKSDVLDFILVNDPDAKTHLVIFNYNDVI